MPGCHMKIFSEGKVAENVKIGDTLEIVVNIDQQDIYGLYVTDCIVRDGLGLGEQKLVNEDGCPMDTEIMGPFKYSSDRSTAKVSFPAHRFPYTSAVYYQCNVKLCALVDPSCHKVRELSLIFYFWHHYMLISVGAHVWRKTYQKTRDWRWTNRRRSPCNDRGVLWLVCERKCWCRGRRWWFCYKGKGKIPLFTN